MGQSQSNNYMNSHYNNNNYGDGQIGGDGGVGNGGGGGSRSNTNLTTTATTTAVATSGRRRSFRSPFLRRKKHKQPLSATFQVPCTSNFEALNINAATAEQFMTLPGINRRIAQSIIDHRNAIGGRFQRIDDLALVSGIGAEKLEQIRPEICIKRLNRSVPGGSSSLSSRTPSLDSIFSEPNLSNQKVILNVNTSSVFQLQQIHGMNQEIAANLVDYRNRKGKFKSLDDLVKVKGLSQVRLGAIKSSLCVNDDDIPKTPKFSHSSTPIYSQLTTPIRNGYTNNGGNHLGHRKSMSVPIKMNLNLTNGFSNAPVNDIFDLLGAYSHRPVVEETYNYRRNGHNTMRIASWNFDRMTVEKSMNLGVKEVICRTILENKFSIVCLQEICEPQALQIICDELNHPTLRRVNEWKENSRRWKLLINSTCKLGQLNGLGFLYDNDRCQLMVDNNNTMDISLDDCKTSTNLSAVVPSAFLIRIKFNDWTCLLLNLYLRYYDMDKIENIINKIDERLKGIQQQQQQQQQSHSNSNQNHENQTTNISNIFLVAGDFSGIDYDAFMETQKLSYITTTTTKNKKLNNADQKLSSKSHVKSKSHKSGSVTSISSSSSVAVAAASTTTQSSTMNLENLGYYQIFEKNQTSYSREQPLNRSDIISNCNILCRDKMPSLRSAFREAIYKTKSPLTVFNSHSTNNCDQASTKYNVLPGYSGIVRQGLCHMAIPKGWSWGGPASEHCPIWIEVFECKERSSSTNNHNNNNNVNCTNNDLVKLKANLTTASQYGGDSGIGGGGGGGGGRTYVYGDPSYGGGSSDTINNVQLFNDNLINKKRLSRNHSLGSTGTTNNGVGVGVGYNKMNGGVDGGYSIKTCDLDISTDSVFLK